MILLLRLGGRWLWGKVDGGGLVRSVRITSFDLRRLRLIVLVSRVVPSFIFNLCLLLISFGYLRDRLTPFLSNISTFPRIQILQVSLNFLLLPQIVLVCFLLGQKLLCLLLLHLLPEIVVVIVLRPLFNLSLVDDRLHGGVRVSCPYSNDVAKLISHRGATSTLAKFAKEAIIVRIGAFVHFVNIVSSLGRSKDMARGRPNLILHGWLLLDLLLDRRWAPSSISLNNGDAREARNLRAVVRLLVWCPIWLELGPGATTIGFRGRVERPLDLLLRSESIGG